MWDPHIEGALGYFTLDERGGMITVSPHMDPRHTMDVILHELVHALDQYLGLKLKHNQVHGLGTGLAQALGPYLEANDG